MTWKMARSPEQDSTVGAQSSWAAGSDRRRGRTSQKPQDSGCLGLCRDHIARCERGKGEGDRYRHRKTRSIGRASRQPGCAVRKERENFRFTAVSVELFDFDIEELDDGISLDQK